MLYLLKNNPILIGKSSEEIKLIDISNLNGMKSGKLVIDKFTGRLDNRLLYQIGTESPVIVQTYKDTLDESSKLIDVEVATRWLDDVNSSNDLIDVSRKYFDKEKIRKILVKRRENLEDYLLNEAENSTNPLVPIIFDKIFDYLQLGISVWKKTGKTAKVYNLIDNAPISSDVDIVAIFSSIDATITSINDLMNFTTELVNETITPNLPYKIKEYLKLFIK